jgi:hypothetical protein
LASSSATFGPPPRASTVALQLRDLLLGLLRRPSRRRRLLLQRRGFSRSEIWASFALRDASWPIDPLPDDDSRLEIFLFLFGSSSFFRRASL